MLKNNSSKLNKANGIAKIFIDPMGSESNYASMDYVF